VDPNLLSHIIEQSRLLVLAHQTRGEDKRSIVVKGSES